MFRIADIIRRSTYTTDIKAFFNVLRLIMYLYLYIHIVGCLFWSIIERNAPEVYLKDIERGYYYPLYDYEEGLPYRVDQNNEFCTDFTNADCTFVEADPVVDRKFGTPHYFGNAEEFTW